MKSVFAIWSPNRWAPAWATPRSGSAPGTPLTVREFTQGAIQTSSGLLDAAIQGDGFFIVQDGSGHELYTRAGNFQADKYGNLLTDTGDEVQGWTTLNSATGAIDTNGPVEQYRGAGRLAQGAGRQPATSPSI